MTKCYELIHSSLEICYGINYDDVDRYFSR